MSALADRIAAAKQRTAPPPPLVPEWVRLAREKRLPVRVNYGRTA